MAHTILTSSLTMVRNDLLLGIHSMIAVRDVETCCMNQRVGSKLVAR